MCSVDPNSLSQNLEDHRNYTKILKKVIEISNRNHEVQLQNISINHKFHKLLWHFLSEKTNKYKCEENCVEINNS